MSLTAIVLTYNEARHLPRCLASLEGVADDVLVVDSFSTDDTQRIAEAHGARVVQHPFVTQATQFNWALTQLNNAAEWILRIDADEYLTSALRAEIRRRLPAINPEISGIFVRRRMVFQGRLIRHGGVSSIRVLRLFRHRRGRCENRWMDEHIKVDGATMDFEGDLIDHNLNSLTWWTAKHNQYASREAIDLLNLEYRFLPHDSVANLRGGDQAGAKRWIKEIIYARLPGGGRALAYFLYRYFVRFGVLDGRAGAMFHFLQGFWYRYLVDAKIAEVKRHMKEQKVGVIEAVENRLGICITSDGKGSDAASPGAMTAASAKQR